MTDKPITHSELVERAAKWLKNTKRCGVVLTEFKAYCSEEPDAFGLTNGGAFSYLIECKTSLGDFYADKNKYARRMARMHPETKCGLGRERYFMTPPGLIDLSKLERNAPNWGLLEVCGRIVKVVKPSGKFNNDLRDEMALLYSLERRREFGDVKGEYLEIVIENGDKK